MAFGIDMRIARALPAILAILALSSCATAPDNASPPAGPEVSASMVLESSPLADGVETLDFSQLDILEMTPEMKAFVDSYVGDANNMFARMRRLLHAVVGDGNFDLVYDDKTRTAQETFRDARGNCLSFTNLFIAMARYLDLNASYQEVDIPPDWSLVGESFLFSQHINVLVDLGVGLRTDVITGTRMKQRRSLTTARQRVVDFNNYDFRITYERGVISDERARAHYFSNIGVDHMLNGDTALAYANFRQALLEDSSFSPAWINMGVLHRRENYPGYAEAAFKQALAIDRFNRIAMSNLANLYKEEELMELAEFYNNKVERHRMNNPYYRYFLAQNAVIDGDYNAAKKHLEFAISKRENEDRFYFLMSMSYLMSGDKEAANTWMAKAEELAGDDDDRQRYQNKMDRLFMSQGLNRQQ
jgi:Tfp pilus assembly protein PilF